MRLLELFEAVDPGVLYHATLKDRIPEIEANGLVPRVGSMVKHWYGDKERNILTVNPDDRDPVPLVYAAHGKGGRGKLFSVLMWLVGQHIGKRGYTPTWEEVLEYGTIGIIDSDSGKFKKGRRDYKGHGQPYKGIESGDWYAEEPVRVDRWMSDAEVARFLSRQKGDAQFGHQQTQAEIEADDRAAALWDRQPIDPMATLWGER